jgi:hypothetical protein
MTEKKKQPRQDREFYDKIRSDMRREQEKKKAKQKEAQEIFERLGMVTSR